MLKSYVIAEINHLVRGMTYEEISMEDLEEGIDVETPNFVLTLKIDRGLCTVCEYHKPMLDTHVCKDCSDGRMQQRRMEDLYF